MYEVLQILELMISLGFYDTESELRQIIAPVIKLLDGSLDFLSSDEETQMKAYEQEFNAAMENPLTNKMPEKINREAGPRYKVSWENNIIF